MSKEKLQAFAEAVSRSEELQKQVASIQVETAKSTAEKMAKLSEAAGTPFTANEYLTTIAESSDEMSEGQLGAVAGGVWNNTEGNVLLSFATFGVGCGIAAFTSVLIRENPDECQPAKS